jgi:hypothetical protein
MLAERLRIPVTAQRVGVESLWPRWDTCGSGRPTEIFRNCGRFFKSANNSNLEGKTVTVGVGTALFEGVCAEWIVLEDRGGWTRVEIPGVIKTGSTAMEVLRRTAVDYEQFPGLSERVVSQP